MQRSVAWTTLVLTRTSLLYHCLAKSFPHRFAHQSRHPENIPQSLSHQPQATLRLPDELITILDSHLSPATRNDVLYQMAKSSPFLSEHLFDPEKVRRMAVTLVKCGMYQRSTQLLRLAHELGSHLKQNAYECTAHQLAAAKQWNAVLFVVGLGLRHSRRSSVRLLNWRTRALLETQRFTELESILVEFDRHKLLPNRRTFHLLISGHIRNHNLGLAKECLQRMALAGYTPNSSTFAMVASVYRPLGLNTEVQLQAIEALPHINQQNGTTTAVLNSLLQMQLDARNLSGVLDLLLLFDQERGGSAIVTVFGKFTATDTMAPRQQSQTRPPSHLPSIIPDADTCTILINYAASQCDRSSAMQFLQAMISIGIPPSPDLVASLVNVLCATGDEGTAVKLVSQTCGASVRHLFERLASPAPQSHISMDVSALKPTTRVFNSLLRGILNHGGISRMLVILRIMHTLGIAYNAATLQIILSYLDRNEAVRPRELLRIIRSLSGKSIKPTLRHMHIIFRSVFRREKVLLHGSGWDAFAFKYPERHSKVPINRISDVGNLFDPTAGLQLPRRNAYGLLAQPIIRSLIDRRVKSDAAMMALRIRHDAVIRSDLESAKASFQSLLDRGIRPTAYHFAGMMEGYALAGDILSAEEVMLSAIDAGVQPNVVMYTILIVGHARKGKPHLALRTFQRMVLAKIKPDVPSIDAVASAFYIAGSAAMARRVLLNLWDHIQPLPGDLNQLPLKDLARRFRQLHRSNQGQAGRLSKHDHLMLHWKVNKLIRLWSLSNESRLRITRSSK